MSRGRGLLAVAAAVWLVVGVAVVVVVSLRWGLATGGTLGGLVVGSWGVPTAVVGLWRWWRSAAATADLEKLAVELGQAVFDQWKEEAKIRSLHWPKPMPVRWRMTTRAVMHHPPSTGRGVLPVTDPADQISGLARQFRDLRGQRLVILGGPGSGKTTLAVQLVLKLSDPETRRVGMPVPVLLPVDGWDTTVHERLADWLAARLAEDYPGLRANGPGSDTGATRLVTRGRVLPVLDGLDELPDTARAAVIRAINESLAEGDGLILTSRTGEYADAVTTAGTVLSSAAVIEPDPLTPADTASYLRQCLLPDPGPEWERVLTALGIGAAGPLTDTLATPLNVWLLRKIYIDNQRDPGRLLERSQFPDPTTIRIHLFEQIISAVLTSRKPGTNAAEPFRPRHDWKPDDARRWLGYVAHLLSDHDTRDFAWWQLARHTIQPSRTRLAFGLAVGLAYGLAFSLAFGLAIGLVCGLAGAVIFGLLMDVRTWLYEEPGYPDLRLHRPNTRASKTSSTLTPEHAPRLAVRIMAGFAVGLVTGVAAGLVAWLAGGLAFGLVGGLPVGLTAGLVFGLATWAGSPALTSTVSTPGSSWRGDRALVLLEILLGGLAFGLAGGLVFGLAGSLAGGFASGPVGGFTIGLAAGLSAGLVSGNHHAWLVYKVATLQLARNKQLPSRLMAFLDDAHRVGLLRAVGPVYQFRHADLHDHLAATHTSQRPDPTPPPASTWDGSSSTSYGRN